VILLRIAIAEYIREILFRIRWLAMSDRQRYSYLWNRTKETL
jgi:hypothetical protein